MVTIPLTALVSPISYNSHKWEERGRLLVCSQASPHAGPFVSRKEAILKGIVMAGFTQNTRIKVQDGHSYGSGSSRAHLRAITSSRGPAVRSYLIGPDTLMG